MAGKPHKDRRKGSVSTRINSWFRRLRDQAGRLSGRLPLPEQGGDPIDFSAPSVHYYTHLAERFNLARIVLYLVLFVFVVATLVSSRDLVTYSNLFYLVKDINASALTSEAPTDLIQYPAAPATPDFASYRGGLVMAGGGEVTVLSGSGKTTLSASLSCGNARIAASDKYFLVWGLGETSFSLFNAFTKVYSETTDFPIYGAAVADDGSFAIVTRSRDYTSEVILYSKNMTRISDYHLRGYVTSLSLAPSGDTAAVLSAEAKDGVYTTKISIIRISDRISLETLTLEDTFGGICGFTAEDRISAVLSDRVLTLRPDGEVLSQVSLDEDSSLCALSAGRVAILARVSGQPSQYRLKVLDKNGRMVYNTVIECSAAPSHMAFGGYNLYIRTTDTLYCMGPDGKTMTTAPVNREVLAVLPEGNEDVLLCGASSARRLHAEDFITP